jgi:hypothetical protein
MLRKLPENMQVVVAAAPEGRRFRYVEHVDPILVRSVAWDSRTLENANGGDDYTVERVLLLRS